MAKSRTSGNISHRERFIAALNHQESDRVPMAFGGPSCSIHRIAHKNLLKYLGYEDDNESLIIDNILQIVEPDYRLYEHFDIDVIWLIPREVPIKWSSNKESYIDALGRLFTLGGGFYNLREFPLKEGTEEELNNYRFPDMLNHIQTKGLREKAINLFSKGYGLAADGPWGLYEYCSSLRGTTELFIDMVDNTKYVELLAERVLEEYLKPYYSVYWIK